MVRKISTMVSNVPAEHKAREVFEGTAETRAAFPLVAAATKSKMFPGVGEMGMTELFAQLGEFLAQFSEEGIRRHCERQRPS